MIQSTDELNESRRFDQGDINDLNSAFFVIKEEQNEEELLSERGKSLNNNPQKRGSSNKNIKFGSFLEPITENDKFYKRKFQNQELVSSEDDGGLYKEIDSVDED